MKSSHSIVNPLNWKIHSWNLTLIECESVNKFHRRFIEKHFKEFSIKSKNVVRNPPDGRNHHRLHGCTILHFVWVAQAPVEWCKYYSVDFEHQIAAVDPKSHYVTKMQPSRRSDGSSASTPTHVCFFLPHCAHQRRTAMPVTWTIDSSDLCTKETTAWLAIRINAM